MLYVEPADRRHRPRDGPVGPERRCTPRRGSASAASGTTRATRPDYSGSGIYKSTDAGQDVDADQRRACRRRRSAAASASTSRAPTRTSSTPSWTTTRSRARRRPVSSTPTAGSAPASSRARRSTAPTTRARPGGRSASRTMLMERLAGTYGWVFGQIRVDPSDENTVYMMGLGLNVSKDGGRTFQPLRRHARRPSRPLDRPGQPELPDQRQRRRHRRVLRPGAALARVPRQPAGRAVLQRVVRHGHAVPRLRLDPGSRQPPRRWSTSAAGAIACRRRSSRARRAARAAGTPSTRATRTSSTRGLLPQHHPRRRRRRSTRAGRAQSSSITPQSCGPPTAYLRGQWLSPIVLSVHNPDVVYFGGAVRVPVVEPRRHLGEDQRRPDLQRPEAAGRHPVPDGLRAVRVAACVSACSMRAPTMAGCT